MLLLLIALLFAAYSANSQDDCTFLAQQDSAFFELRCECNRLLGVDNAFGWNITIISDSQKPLTQITSNEGAQTQERYRYTQREPLNFTCKVSYNTSIQGVIVTHYYLKYLDIVPGKNAIIFSTSSTASLTTTENTLPSSSTSITTTTTNTTRLMTTREWILDVRSAVLYYYSNSEKGTKSYQPLVILFVLVYYLGALSY